MLSIAQIHPAIPRITRTLCPCQTRNNNRKCNVAPPISGARENVIRKNIFRLRATAMNKRLPLRRVVDLGCRKYRIRRFRAWKLAYTRNGQCEGVPPKCVQCGMRMRGCAARHPVSRFRIERAHVFKERIMRLHFDVYEASIPRSQSLQRTVNYWRSLYSVSISRAAPHWLSRRAEDSRRFRTYHAILILFTAARSPGPSPSRGRPVIGQITQIPSSTANRGKFARPVTALCSSHILVKVPLRVRALRQCVYVWRRSCALCFATTRPCRANAAVADDAAGALNETATVRFPHNRPPSLHRLFRVRMRDRGRTWDIERRCSTEEVRRQRGRVPAPANRPRLCFSMESALPTMAATSPSKVRQFPFFFLRSTRARVIPGTRAKQRLLATRVIWEEIEKLKERKREVGGGGYFLDSRLATKLNDRAWFWRTLRDKMENVRTLWQPVYACWSSTGCDRQ